MITKSKTLVFGAYKNKQPRNEHFLSAKMFQKVINKYQISLFL